MFQIVCLDIRHVTKDGEGDDAGKEAGGGVDEARDDGVLDAVVVELVVGAERGQGTRPDAERIQRPTEVRFLIEISIPSICTNPPSFSVLILIPIPVGEEDLRR